MNRILVTGGCGFVGVNLLAFLRKNRDCDIVVLDDLSLGRAEHAAPYSPALLTGDIRDADLVKEAVKGADAIVHLAADTRVLDSIKDPGKNFDVNVRGSLTLLEAARDQGVSSFVFASTGGAIIGHANPPVHEGMVPRPASPYGASKLAAEGYLSAYAGSYGLNSTALRFSNVFGPRSYHKGSVVAQLFKNILARQDIQIYGDGSQTRDFVYVDDICTGILQSIDTKEKGGAVYQLGSGIATSINQLLDSMRDVIKPHPMPKVIYRDFRPGEVIHTHSDISKARAGLGFVPAIALEEGLKRTWTWFLEAAAK